MDRPASGEAELSAAIRRYVTPGPGDIGRYLDLLHGNFVTMGETERTPFLQQLARSARQVSDRELATLLSGDWRPRLTASWLIGLSRREQFRGQIGEMLLASEMCYAGQGYCFALARFATTADAELLAAYLDVYLPQPDKDYDQDWALGALLHLDEQQGANRAARYLTDDGPGHRWSKTDGTTVRLRERIDRLCTAADECMRMS